MPAHHADAAVLKALGHPVRLRLLDELIATGPATVGMLALRTDEAVGSVSHHLRSLADAGLVHVAPELARNRRERWWRADAGTQHVLGLARNLRLAPLQAEAPA